MNAMRSAGLLFFLIPLIASEQAAAERRSESLDSPRWSYEIRGGEYQPDLPLFETFYGDDSETYYGLTAGYRLKDWLEVGAEYTQMRADGLGLLTISQELGGSVRYRLNPIYIYSSFILQRRATQRVVPYADLGLAWALYQQKVQQQSDVDGHTDLGYAGRLGVRFLITSAAAQHERPHWASYLFLEAQKMSFKADDTELGGTAYVLGFRMEFDFRGP